MDSPPSSVRTCIGCRRRGPAAEMARLALREGRVVVWRGRRPSGRGASIHPTEACVREAVKQGAFARAFRARVEGVETLALLDEIAGAATDKPNRQDGT